jgi:type I restriction enzyme, S subunit
VISRESIKNGHPIKPLGELVEFLDSQRRPITEKDRLPGPYPYYGANGQQDSVADHIFDEPLILLAEDGGYFDEADRGIAYAIEGKTWVNNHAHVLRPRDCIRLDFLTRVLQNYDITPWINGSTRAKLTQAAASRIEIPLPPLAEQKRIAGILDAADALRAKRREALAQLDTLLQATFLDMFGDPVANPKGWEQITIGEFIASAKYSLKRGPFGGALKKEIFVNEGFKVYQQQNVIYEDFQSGRYFISERDYERMSAFAVHADDILVSCSGTIGKIAVVPSGAAPGVMNQALMKIRLDKSRMLTPFFVNLWRSGPFERQVLGMTHGTGMKNMKSMEELKAIEFIVPPIGQQRGFTNVVQSINKQMTSHRHHLTELDSLFASLQSRAFRGEL